uniref:GxxExxY protein n=1 Tax=Candidatus Methanogaster sp. ANME-2c ERB4 TaxID=2759911 RepID=A0A7G9YHG0_9EURY|nr:hypothetical protein IILFPGFB_00016 [Methanosarcinales archaeon ANME-2c ERB4]
MIEEQDVVFMTQLKHHHITEKIIGAAYKVHNTLGSGFLEKVYQNSLAIELRSLGFYSGCGETRLRYTIMVK